MKEREFIVEKLVAGGYGIVRAGNETVFVPYVIPGEKVGIEIEPGSKKPIRAKLVEIVIASPDLVEPPCVLFGRCGGCQFQHINYEAQLKFKVGILSENVAWMAKIRPDINPIVSSAKHYNYRSRIKLHVKGDFVGFYAERKKDFLPVKYCHLAHDSINDAISSLNSLFRYKPKTIELINENDEYIVAIVEGAGWRKIFRFDRNRELSEEWQPARDQKVAFEQVNVEQNAVLRNIVRDAVARIKPEGVIELYSGSGNLTEVILPYASWLAAVDSDRRAVVLGRDKFRGISGKPLKFVHKRAEDYLEYALNKGLKPDLIVLDPPRTGAKEAIKGILDIAPKYIIYVSCDPATLARDLKSLLADQYKLQSLTPIDMFPQTAHIEAVAALSR